MRLKTALISIFTGISITAAILLFASIFKHNSEKILDILITTVAILICVAFLMIIWIYSSILKPLSKLQEATRKIKEGNLDFTLDFEEHDEIGQLCMDFEEMRIRLKENEEEKFQADNGQ